MTSATSGGGDERARIALLHFSSPPLVGGIEELVRAQVAALSGAGHAVRLVTGHGDPLPPAELCVVPELDPATESTGDRLDRLTGRVRSALEGCSQCWVLNAFTVTLHPTLTMALHRLVHEMPHLRFVNWCCDMSAASRYAPSETAFRLTALLRDQPRIAHVAISRARRADLSFWTGVPEDEIDVVSPAVDALAWLGTGAEARAIVARLQLPASDFVALVPAKVLPHKNLDFAVKVGRHLAARVPTARLVITAASSPHQTRESRSLLAELRREVAARMLEENVVFLSDVTGAPPTRELVRDLMTLSDVVFLPSREEGFGMPLLESAVMRVPCLCSDIPAFHEAGGDGAMYFSLSSRPATVARRMLALQNTPANRHRRAALMSFQGFASDVDRLARLYDSRSSSLNPSFPARSGGVPSAG